MVAQFIMRGALPAYQKPVTGGCSSKRTATTDRPISIDLLGADNIEDFVNNIENVSIRAVGVYTLDGAAERLSESAMSCNSRGN